MTSSSLELYEYDLSLTFGFTISLSVMFQCEQSIIVGRCVSCPFDVFK